MPSIAAHYGRPAATVRADATAAEAARLMADLRIGSLAVTDETAGPLGLVGERELVARVLALRLDADATPVSDVMIRDVPSVSPQESAERCAELMKQAGTRHLLVMENGRLAGVVSMRDVIRALLDEREAQVQQLTNYITGRG